MFEFLFSSNDWDLGGAWRLAMGTLLRLVSCSMPEGQSWDQ